MKTTKLASDELKTIVAETVCVAAITAVVEGRFAEAIQILETRACSPYFNHAVFGADYRRAIEAIRAA